jgi:hypothetical protein
MAGRVTVPVVVAPAAAVNAITTLPDGATVKAPAFCDAELVPPLVTCRTRICPAL